MLERGTTFLLHTVLSSELPKGGTFFLPLSKVIISNDMRISMPKLPQSLDINPTMFNLIQEFVVDGKVIRLTKDVASHDDITSLIPTIVPKQK